MATDVKEAGHNPKRIQREVRKQLQNTGIGKITTGFEITAGAVEN